MNPFRVGEPVGGEFFTDRADEVERIRRAMVEPSRLLVMGPRRMGKTSAIRVAAEGARRAGARVVWADLSTASSPADVANRLLRAYSTEIAEEKGLLDFARELRPRIGITFDPATGVPVLALDLERRSRSTAELRADLEEVLDGFEREAAASDAPFCVVLDEFQEIVEIGGDRADWHLRGVLQRHQHLSYVCAGSKEGLIREMTGRKQAFYRQFELLHVGPIEPRHLATWIDARLETERREPSGAGALLVQRAGPRTQDVLQAARALHYRTRAGDRIADPEVEAALDEVMWSEEPVIRTIWDGLTSLQQDALRAVASGVEQLFAAGTLRRFGIASTSSLDTALDALAKKEVLVREGRTVTFDNPFFGRWVRRIVLEGD